MKKEAKWQTMFNQYIREKRFYGYFELKQTIKDYFPFAKIELSQYESLRAMEKNGLVWKLSDEDQRQKPCDSFCTPPLPTYLVIKFDDGFYFLRIKDIEELKAKGAIGITLEMAKEIAERVLITKVLTPTSS